MLAETHEYDAVCLAMRFQLLERAHNRQLTENLKFIHDIYKTNHTIQMMERIKAAYTTLQGPV